MSDHEIPQPPSRDDVARLIRMAGRRASVPEDRAARVKAAVWHHWNHEVGARRRRRTLRVAALSAAALLAMFAGIELVRRLSLFSPVDPEISIEAVLGQVRVDGEGGNGTDRTAAPRADDRLALGAAVETGTDGRVALRLGRAGSVRLDAGTRVRVLGRGKLALDRGALYVDSGRSGTAAGPETLTIETPLGSVQDLGTQFEVRLGEGSVRVRVREGRVILDHAGRHHEVPAAGELSYDGASAPEVRPIPIYGPEWDWAAQAVKVPDLEGRSALSFLEWVARERGWRLEFSGDLERSARDIVLEGSAERLTLEEALDAVLPTCGMQYRVEGGVLSVAPLATAPAPG